MVITAGFQMRGRDAGNTGRGRLLLLAPVEGHRDLCNCGRAALVHFVLRRVLTCSQLLHKALLNSPPMQCAAIKF
jgi:hypothetical protein